MNKQLSIPFQVTLWELTPYDDAQSGITLMRGTVKKSLSGDELTGESTGEILLYSNTEGSAAYTVMDKFTVEIAGRKGSFVALHSAVHTPGDTSRALGTILTGSGTDDLAGISGTIEFKEGEAGKTLELDITF